MTADALSYTNLQLLKICGIELRHALETGCTDTDIMEGFLARRLEFAGCSHQKADAITIFRKLFCEVADTNATLPADMRVGYCVGKLSRKM